MLNFNDYVKQNMGVGMTMASPSAWMDDEGYTYCSDCADIKEE